MKLDLLEVELLLHSFSSKVAKRPQEGEVNDKTETITMVRGTLIHLTNYYGHEIDEQFADDPDMWEAALWFQAVPGHWNAQPCCPGYGQRSITVGPDRLRRWLDNEGPWNMYLVNEKSGDNPYHYFYKYVLAVEGSAADQEMSWQYNCEFSHVYSDTLWSEIMAIAEACWDADYSCKNHVHIGISGFSQPLDLWYM